jgi:hypothetical protein
LNLLKGYITIFTCKGKKKQKIVPVHTLTKKIYLREQSTLVIVLLIEILGNPELYYN